MPQVNTWQMYKLSSLEKPLTFQRRLVGTVLATNWSFLCHHGPLRKKKLALIAWCILHFSSFYFQSCGLVLSVVNYCQAVNYCGRLEGRWSLDARLAGLMAPRDLKRFWLLFNYILRSNDHWLIDSNEIKWCWKAPPFILVLRSFYGFYKM